MDKPVKVENELSDNVSDMELSDEKIFLVFDNVDSYVRKQYLSELKNAEVVPIDAKLLDMEVGRNVRMFKIDSFSYGTDDDIYGKLSDIYGALSGFKSNQVIILDSDGYKTNFYLGVACDEIDKLGMQFDTFRGTFSANFPGGKLSMLDAGQSKELLDSVFDESGIQISSVSALSVPQGGSGESIFGIERFINGMYGKPFTMMLVAESVPQNELRTMRQTLEAMYSELSPYREYNISISSGDSTGYSESFSLAKSESATEGVSISENATLGKSKNNTIAVQQQEKEKNKNARNQLIGTAVSLGALMLGAGGECSVLQSLFYGSSISNIIGSAQTLISGAQNPVTETESDGESYSLGFSKQENKSVQKGISTTKGLSVNSGNTSGKNLQLQYRNMSVTTLLNVIEQQIARLQHIEGIGGHNIAAYLVTGDYTTSLMAANLYRSLLKSGDSLLQCNAVNVWDDKYSVKSIGQYLKLMHHPVFHFESRIDYPVFTAASLVASDEIPRYFSLPDKSLCGLPVTTHAEFSREVKDCYSREDSLEIGRIYHMGKTEPQKLSISRSALRGHMFVAGTTGMGKSNFCYGLLNELYNSNVKFMVIEPAKGEYAKVFGGYEGVHCFGTNPNLSPLLKINPFAFPDGIHVNEHIDRLLEIFNSCWSMYAAMPAVLKEAMEVIYKNCGYDLVTGTTNKKHNFPSFSDLLAALNVVINKSKFSGEVKGNYVGSLVTRVSSLTDGLYGCIFTEDEIAPQTLFDGNVLIDLSRVGSGETKALIMGLLVMKLQEYRMASEKMNVSLQHVTVLEEAHHLLRGSTPSSAEGVNLRAMSLEMITNAIAEMRTYGEGFVIADQSPSIMDSSVIRNTNTKVVFKLPEYTDRQVVGNAMSLSPEQIAEISKLECGVAAVYQSNWDNAVLSKINYFSEENYKPLKKKLTSPIADDRKVISQFVAAVLKNRLGEGLKSSFDGSACADITGVSSVARQEYIKIIKKYMESGDCGLSFGEICRYFDGIFGSRKMLEQCGDYADISVWHENAVKYVQAIADLTCNEVEETILILINMREKDSRDIHKLYFKEFANINSVRKCTFGSQK